MLSRSKSFALLYFIVAAVLTGLFCLGVTDKWVISAGVPAYRADIMTFLWLVASAMVLLFLKGNEKAIAITGTIFAFIVLTFRQDVMLARYIALGAILFAVGIYGMVSSRNAIRMLISIELMINAANINLVAFARYIDPLNIRGQVFTVFTLVVAAAEAVVGLAIVLAIYRNLSTVDMDRFNILKL